ncbi:IPT/TIG domain-containing protein [Candidatus Bipolaricaulota bacterium]
MRAKCIALTLLLALLLVLSSCMWVQTPIAVVTFSPQAGAVSTLVAITGTAFGSTQGTSVVTFDGVQAQILAWADTAITAKIPVLPTPNGERPATVNVVRGGATIGTGTFTLQRGVLFDSGRDGNPEIYMMNPDGSQPSNLTNHPETDMHAAWSPDGTKIAFVSRRSGNNEIYVMNADGSNPVNLTNHPDSDDYPVWSPNGDRIAFTTDRESLGPLLSVDPMAIISDFNVEIFVMNANGSGQVNVSNHFGWDGFPSWSPDGEHLVFQTDRDDDGGIILLGIIPADLGQEIYVVEANGDNPTNLSNSPENDTYPRWSPDGSKIVFESHRDGNREIYVMNRDGTGQTRLTNHPESDMSPSWSPDSAWITFHSVRDGNMEIYKMTVAGLAQTRLTTDPEWDWGPSWSPDGSEIVFQSFRDGNAEIYKMGSSGASQVRLTNDPEWDAYPIWGTPAWMPPI